MRRLKVLFAALVPSKQGSPANHFSHMNVASLEEWNVTNFDYRDSPHPVATLRTPGLNHESFDNELNPKITSIMMLSGVSRLYSLNVPLPTHGANGAKPGNAQMFFLDWPRLTDKYFTFVSSSEFVLSRAMYDKSVKKSPLDMKSFLGYVGNSSVAHWSEFYACSDEEGSSGSRQTLLWTNLNQLVTVDKSTRKPARLPDWFQEKYSGRGCLEKGLILRPFNRPDVTFVSQSVVPWEDIDYYHHTNWTAYVRWAVNALYAALLVQGKTSAYPLGTSNPIAIESSGSTNPPAVLHGITKEIVSRGVRKLQIIYLRECVEGDRVETHVWQEMGTEKELVWFSVVKNGEDICQIKIWFFEEENENESL